MSTADWNDIMRGRSAAAEKLPHLLKLPRTTGGRDLLLKQLKDGDLLLDIGANDRNLKRFIEENGFKVDYRSFDVDTTLPHDYYDLGSIDAAFDVITAFEVIEHMEVHAAVEIFGRVKELLKPGGIFVLSTPNVCNPVVFWRDCTHITPFRYDELYGLLTSTGFKEIEVYRAGSFRMKDRLLGLYYRPLLKLLRMDFAPGIVAVARS